MKSSKLVMAAVAVALMCAAFGLPAMAQPAAAAGANAPQAKWPVLNIGGKESADVYLQSLDIQVEVTGNIASTRYTMVFKNRTSRQLEGDLIFPLPDGRTVTHYALDVNGKMREAVPVDKARAAQVFEEIQQRPAVIDPGILERVEGNNFRTRIYPFPRNGTRTISIGYEEELSLEKNLLYYRLPMAYPSPLEKFSVKATVWESREKPVVPAEENEIRFDKAGRSYVATFTRENYRPSRALIFALPAPSDIPQVMMQPAQGSYYFLASVAVNLGTRKKQWSDNLAVIWDVSLSGSQRDLQRETGALNTIFADKKDANVHLYFLNNRFNRIINPAAPKGEYKVVNGNWDELKKMLETAIFDGGTDFSQISLKDVAGDEILFFSDGISTLSDPDIFKGEHSTRPIHCIVSSSKADYSVMKLISGKSAGKFVNISALSAKSLTDELLNETPQFLGTEGGASVREVYPGIATPVSGNFSVAGISGTDNTEITLLFGYGSKVEKRIKIILDAKTSDNLGNIYKIWAQKKIAELDLDYKKNRAELTALGNQFGIVTRNTSLMVLELVSDYILYNIEPPASDSALCAEYQRSLKWHRNNALAAEHSRLNAAVTAAEKMKAWWDTEYTPKYPVPDDTRSQSTPPPPPAPQAQFAESVQPAPRAQEAAREPSGAERQTGGAQARAVSAAAPEPKTGSGASSKSRAFSYDAAEVVGFLDNPTPIYIIDMDDPGADLISLDRSFKEYWEAEDSPLHTERWHDVAADERIYVSAAKARQLYTPLYMRGLTGDIALDYKTYLKARAEHAGKPAFYFDMANWFYNTVGNRETALRILTSIAELELENAPLYRLLGYKFKEYGENKLQKFVTSKVTEWRPMEPQSYRDYALALADNNDAQAALDSLYSLLTRTYSANINRRSSGVDEAVIMEMNRLIAKYPNLDTSNIDKRLITDMPVDVRVVMNWNMDNTDINMEVIDPNGDISKSYDHYYDNRHGYRNKRTKIGGTVTNNNTSGYGPEQFVLKNAVPGKYQMLVYHRSSREFASTDPITVMVEIYTKYAGREEQRRVVCLQLSKKPVMHYIVEFEL